MQVCLFSFVYILCGRPIGRITRLAGPSVCPFVMYGLVTRKQKKIKKNKININVPQGTSKWNANFQFSVERSEVKVTGRQKHQEIATHLAHVFTYGQPIKRRLQTRPNHCWT